MNKAVAIMGKEGGINNRKIRNKTELSNIINIISQDIIENGVGEFQRVGKYGSEKHKPIKVTFQSAKIMKEVMGNTKSLKDEDEIKNKDSELLEKGR